MEKLRYAFTDRLTTEEIAKIVEDYKESIVPQVVDRKEYSKGNNTAILTRTLPVGSPQNKVPSPYGRRITSIVSSYMYLPGLITYNSEDQAYLEAILDIFKANEEPLESYRLGWQSTVQGVGYELFYNEGVGATTTLVDKQPGFDATAPLFVRVPVEETIPIYDFAIDPVLQAFIRFHTEDKREVVEVWYATDKLTYERKSESASLGPLDEQVHGYGRPPLVVYENNDDMIGDFSSVMQLIDAYDVLTSDSMNEFDRFAQAYLIFKGMSLSPDDLDQLKAKRAFNLLNADDSVSFLTKKIETEFIQFMTEHIRAEIHRGSGIPDLDDYKWGGSASGETIGKFIYMMELVTGIKEAYFKRGLWDRIAMLTEYGGWDADPHDIDIVMNRNDPDKSLLLAELMEKYSGHISQRTLLANFADFITDVDAELVLLAEEKDAAFAFDLDDEPEEPEEEEEEAVAEEENADVSE